jgi:FAD/FMN-containing dehydrogenase
VLESFALAIVAANSPPAFAHVSGLEPDLARAERETAAIDRAMTELLRVVPNPGSYVSESDFFESDWRRSYWGENYPRLARVKEQYDPSGLFFVHHGVGSERWSADGFTRVQ